MLHSASSTTARNGPEWTNGDGVLTYFGYPRVQEHDAERAVRAGLALVEAVPKFDGKAGAPLQARVGIGVGLVIVGRSSDALPCSQKL